MLLTLSLTQDGAVVDRVFGEFHEYGSWENFSLLAARLAESLYIYNIGETN